MSAETKQIIQRFYDEVINGRKLDVLDELAITDLVEHEEIPGVAPPR
jgi:hypothetical protein